MNYRVREYLIDLCTKGKMITYQELSNSCELGLDMHLPNHRAEIAKILGEISTFEHNNCRPLLTAIVVTKTKQTQGDGFFKLGELLEYGPWKSLKKNYFDIEQIKKCYEFWQIEENYENFRNINYE